MPSTHILGMRVGYKLRFAEDVQRVNLSIKEPAASSVWDMLREVSGDVPEYFSSGFFDI